MDKSKTLEAFFDSIQMLSTESYSDGLKGIAKRLNTSYYDSDSDEDHLILVGSVGRGTAVEGASDVDALFVLPHEIYVQYDNRAGNKQSQLLSDVRTELKKRYPNSDISADGQAVVVSFTDRNYSIDLVPAFERSDGSFTYPDSNDGGHWRKTDPIPEQEACEETQAATRGTFMRLCNALRVWKDNVGFNFNGLLIDTFVARFLDERPEQCLASLRDYDSVFIDLFSYLKSQDPDQAYWYALGSNQQIFNDGKSAFVAKAKKAHKALTAGEEDIESALSELFGKRFDDCIVDSAVREAEAQWSRRYSYWPDTEQFIEDMFPIHIRYDLDIDCDVSQNGFREHTLREMLRKRFPLLRGRSLTFRVVKTNVPEPFTLYWKVRNCGEEAFRKTCVRGQIVEDEGNWAKPEHTNFRGPHYVECYAVKNEVCVARSRISVPISAQ